ncbi:MAG: hypothetical protein LBS69_07895, partial [Prevotellaceae bacterium]|nr:hypothetical protein [Prevotellaceae bacterium]
ANCFNCTYDLIEPEVKIKNKKSRKICRYCRKWLSPCGARRTKTKTAAILIRKCSKQLNQANRRKIFLDILERWLRHIGYLQCYRKGKIGSGKRDMKKTHLFN